MRDGHIDRSGNGISNLYKLYQYLILKTKSMNALTAATTVSFPLLRQLCGVCTMTESETWKPAPLLLYVWVDPEVKVIKTIKEEIEEAVGILALNP